MLPDASVSLALLPTGVARSSAQSAPVYSRAPEVVASPGVGRGRTFVPDECGTPVFLFPMRRQETKRASRMAPSAGGADCKLLCSSCLHGLPRTPAPSLEHMHTLHMHSAPRDGERDAVQVFGLAPQPTSTETC